MQTLELVEASGGDDMLLAEVEGKGIPKFLGRGRIRLEVLRWRPSKEPCGLGLLPAGYHLVVNVHFSVGLLDEGHPPAAVLRGLRERWLIVVGREQIVDGDLLGAALDEDTECEDALVIVLVLVEDTGDEAVELAQGGQESEEVVVSE